MNSKAGQLTSPILGHPTDAVPAIPPPRNHDRIHEPMGTSLIPIAAVRMFFLCFVLILGSDSMYGSHTSRDA